MTDPAEWEIVAVNSATDTQQSLELPVVSANRVPASEQ